MNIHIDISPRFTFGQGCLRWSQGCHQRILPWSERHCWTKPWTYSWPEDPISLAWDWQLPQEPGTNTELAASGLSRTGWCDGHERQDTRGAPARKSRMSTRGRRREKEMSCNLVQFHLGLSQETVHLQTEPLHNIRLAFLPVNRWTFATNGNFSSSNLSPWWGRETDFRLRMMLGASKVISTLRCFCSSFWGLWDASSVKENMSVTHRKLNNWTSQKSI